LISCLGGHWRLLNNARPRDDIAMGGNADSNPSNSVRNAKTFASMIFADCDGGNAVAQKYRISAQ
jgi:hypothetical protein